MRTRTTKHLWVFEPSTNGRKVLFAAPGLEAKRSIGFRDRCNTLLAKHVIEGPTKHKYNN